MLVWIPRKMRTALMEHAKDIATLQAENRRLRVLVEGEVSTTDLVNEVFAERAGVYRPARKAGLMGYVALINGRMNTLEEAAAAKCPECQQRLPDDKGKEARP